MSNRKKEIEIRDGEEWMRCTECLEFKLLSTYPIRKGRNIPYRKCTPCRSARTLEWSRENKYRTKVYNKNYRIRNQEEFREKRKLHTKKYYEENKEYVKEKMREYTKFPGHYALRKRLWRKGYDIGDPVLYNGIKFKIVSIRPCVGYCISRAGLPPITVPRKKLTPITYTIC